MVQILHGNYIHRIFAIENEEALDSMPFFKEKSIVYLRYTI